MESDHETVVRRLFEGDASRYNREAAVLVALNYFGHAVSAREDPDTYLAARYRQEESVERVQQPSDHVDIDTADPDTKTATTFEDLWPQIVAASTHPDHEFACSAADITRTHHLIGLQFWHHIHHGGDQDQRRSAGDEAGAGQV